MTYYGSRIKELIGQLERQSKEYYIPAIDREDAAALASLAFMAEPGLIVDLGAGIGYSALWLAIGASTKSNARIVAVEWDEDLGGILERNAHAIERATGVSVEVVVSDALDYLEGLDDNTSFSLAFVDIEKHQYPRAFDHLVKHMISGGIITFHNAYTPAPPKEFFDKISRYNSLILPTPQGLAIVRV